MTQRPPSTLNREILREAADWFVEFRVERVDALARQRFDEWLRQSSEHVRAYLEIARAYAVLPGLTSHRSVDIQQLIADARSNGNVIPFDHAVLTTGAAPLPPRWRTRPSRWRLLGGVLAACMAVASLAVVFVAWLTAHQLPTYATDIHERRSITLDDGSIIDLNARSKVRIRFTSAARGVDLLEGQALFAVAKDKARPFVVRSGTAVVRAVGTQFDVYQKKSGTTVTVVEGRVAVARAGAAAADATAGGAAPAAAEALATLVSAGEQVTVTDRAIVEPRRANVAAATAWMQRRFVFDGARLGDVVEDFNRYNVRQMTIEAPELESFQVSGVYSSTDPASLIRFLREQPGVRIIETDAGTRITQP